MAAGKVNPQGLPRLAPARRGSRTSPSRRCSPTTGRSCARPCAASAAATPSSYFIDAEMDNPLSGLVSFPCIPGHEVVGVVEKVGPGGDARRRSATAWRSTRGCRARRAASTRCARPARGATTTSASTSPTAGSRRPCTPATAATPAAAFAPLLPGPRVAAVPHPRRGRLRAGRARRPVLREPARRAQGAAGRRRQGARVRLRHPGPAGHRLPARRRTPRPTSSPWPATRSSASSPGRMGARWVLPSGSTADLVARRGAHHRRAPHQAALRPAVAARRRGRHLRQRRIGRHAGRRAPRGASRCRAS